jgi:hypothetical protein
VPPVEQQLVVVRQQVWVSSVSGTDIDHMVPLAESWEGRLHPRPVRVHRRTGHHRRRPHPRHHPSSGPQLADRTAKEQGATEQQLQQIAAEGLAQMYLRANNTRAVGLGVEFTDVEHIDIDL